MPPALRTKWPSWTKGPIQRPPSASTPEKKPSREELEANDKTQQIPKSEAPGPKSQPCNRFTIKFPKGTPVVPLRVLRNESLESLEGRVFAADPDFLEDIVGFKGDVTRDAPAWWNAESMLSWGSHITGEAWEKIRDAAVREGINELRLDFVKLE